MTQRDARAALAKLLSVDWARRAEALLKKGWAAMPDRHAPDKAVARLCAVKLGEGYTTVRRSIPLAAPAP